MDRGLFLEATRCAHWADVDELIARLDAAGYWGQPASPEHKRAHAEFLLGTMVDEEGFPLFGRTTVAEGGTERAIYKQVALFDADDHQRVIARQAAMDHRHGEAAGASRGEFDVPPSPGPEE